MYILFTKLHVDCKFVIVRNTSEFFFIDHIYGICGSTVDCVHVAIDKRKIIFGFPFF